MVDGGVIEKRVTTELGVEERHVAIDSSEDVETSVAFVVVVIIGREMLGTSGTFEIVY